LSDFVPLEEVVFLAAWAVGAFKAAEKQERDRCCDEHGEKNFVCREPMKQSVHIERCHGDRPVGRPGSVLSRLYSRRNQNRPVLALQPPTGA
jgi:hypothetical protein